MNDIIMQDRYKNEISVQIKRIILDLDEYMTPYEKGEYLRSLLGDRTRYNYLTLPRLWRNLWDGFYLAQEFTRHFVETLISDITTQPTGSVFAHHVYVKISKRLEEYEVANWEKKNTLFNAKLRDQQFLYTGK